MPADANPPVPNPPAIPDPVVPQAPKKKMSGLVALLLFVVAVSSISGAYFGIRALTAANEPERELPSLTANLVPPTEPPPSPTTIFYSPTPAGPTPTPTIRVFSPAELQTHDNIRISDLESLYQALDVFIAENGTEAFAAQPSTNSQSAAAVRTLSCAANWIGTNICGYLDQVPVDVVNGAHIEALTASGTKATKKAGYGLVVDIEGERFKLCTYLEGEGNAGLLVSDGGTDPGTYEIGTDLALSCSPDT